jgi:hypothetical protein
MGKYFQGRGVVVAARAPVAAQLPATREHKSHLMGMHCKRAVRPSPPTPLLEAKAIKK